jgi:hypothetical protein
MWEKSPQQKMVMASVPGVEITIVTGDDDLRGIGCK